MNQLIKYALPCCLIGFLHSAYAIGTTSTESSRTDNRAYIALNWEFSTTPGMPNLVLGARYVKVKSNDHLSNGADLSVQFTTAGGLSLNRVRVAAIDGKRNGFYGAGIGYNFKTGTPLFSATIGAPHIRLIGDYTIGSGLDGLIQLETLSQPKPVVSSLAHLDS